MKIGIIVLMNVVMSIYCMAQTPKISGSITISMEQGTIDADLVVTNVPSLQKYSLWLNAGLNIEYVRDINDKFNFDYNKYYQSDKSSEAMQYQLTVNDSVVLPAAFKIKYRGAFPVIKDTSKMYELGDWKGNMAFNGKTLRASEQTAWYPIFYDKTNDNILNKVSYNLKFICKDFTSIYLNGSAPSHEASPTLKSDVPVQLMLLAGNFNFDKLDKTNFVNSNLMPSEQSILSKWTSKIIQFYETQLKIPFGSDITYLGASPVSKRNNWAFVCYPTIVVVGNKWSLKEFFDARTHQIKDSGTITYIAHELGHYYFGNLVIPNSELRWFYLEGITDFLSLKATNAILGKNEYKKVLTSYINRVKDFKAIPLSKIKKEDEINERYRYEYIPLLLIALEKEIGEQSFWNWLNYLLNTHPPQLTNYAYFKESLLKSGVKEDEITNFERTYISSETALLNVVKKVQE